MNVLIAEDDRLIRQGLCDLLETEGYVCFEAADGEEALICFEKHNPDLVLLDIMMPKKDGYSVCKEIRRVAEDIPVIFITAKSEEIDQVLGLELGADDYIKKPFGTREVIARIRAVTRRYIKHKQTQEHTGSTPSFQLDDLHVIPDELRAVRGTQVLELSLRDIKILSLLSVQRGKVVTRDMMFNHCWGRDYLASSRTLDQYVSKLRKLIEQDAKNPKIIKTVHGVGYRFDE